MKTLVLTGLAFAIAAGIALPLAGSAEAAIGAALPSSQILPLEKAQFLFLGHNYCWYDGGWQGPGWYWCGFAWNNGNGWGGGEGWNGWSGHGPRANNSPKGFAPHVGVARAPLHSGPTFNKAAHGAPGGAKWTPKG